MQDNPFYPLPPNYPYLSEEEKSIARVEACMRQDTPEEYVAAWSFFRSYYLFPPASYGFYKHGVVPSPQAHYELVYNEAANRLHIVAAPRSFAKSTLLREMNLLELLTRPFHEIVLFLAKEQFVWEQMMIYKKMLEYNQKIKEDFVPYWHERMGIGDSFRPKRGDGLWSNTQIQTTIGSMLTGLPIMGASLGKRPHRIRFDDVEKSESLVKEPAEKITAFKDFLLDVAYPMAEEGCSLSIWGTLLSRRSFLYWLHKTDDPRIVDHFKRSFYAAQMGGEYIWKEKMGEAWAESQKKVMGPAKFNTQYMNDPSADESRVLIIHEDLCTYALDNVDQNSFMDPLHSQALCVSHRLVGYATNDEVKRPVTEKVVRPFGPAVSNMYRFITVDWAPTVSTNSDYSCIHVMGLENSSLYKDTLWSLDLWLDKKRQNELVQMIYRYCLKWKVRFVGIESYGPQLELVERLREDLPNMFGFGEFVPAVIPIKFPPHMEKADKIHGLEWRFDQFRVKLPKHRQRVWPYSQLFYQIENFTDDLGNLDHDDAIDTLAMHLAIGKRLKATGGPDILISKDPIEMLKAGRTHYDNGMPVGMAIDFGKIPFDVVDKAMDAGYDRAAQNPAANFTWHNYQ